MSFSAPMSTHTIRGGAGKRLSFKAKASQSILDQVVHSALRPDFPSPSHDAGQPCSFIIAGEFNLTHDPLVAALQDAVIPEDIDCEASTHVMGTMASTANLVTEQVLMAPVTRARPALATTQGKRGRSKRMQTTNRRRYDKRS